jgi:hypothetical protein
LNLTAGETLEELVRVPFRAGPELKPYTVGGGAVRNVEAFVSVCLELSDERCDGEHPNGGAAIEVWMVIESLRSVSSIFRGASDKGHFGAVSVPQPGDAEGKVLTVLNPALEGGSPVTCA